MLVFFLQRGLFHFELGSVDLAKIFANATFRKFGAWGVAGTRWKRIPASFSFSLRSVPVALLPGLEHMEIGQISRCGRFSSFSGSSPCAPKSRTARSPKKSGIVESGIVESVLLFIRWNSCDFQPEIT